MRRINPPRPPFFFHPPSPFYVGVGALGAPLHRWSPRLYKLPASRVTPPDLRAPDIWARDGFYSCRQTHTPNRGRDPSSLRSATEPGAVAKPKKCTKDRSKHETGVDTCSEHSLRWQSNKLDRVITTIQYSDSTSRERGSETFLRSTHCSLLNSEFHSNSGNFLSTAQTIMYRSTKGASKARRDQINAEIRNLKDLLPISDVDKARLSYLHIMSLACMYTRKSVYFNKGE